MEVSFSKRIAAVTATNTANYSLTGPDGAVTILSAAQDTSQSNVLLTVAAMIEESRLRRDCQ